MSLRNAFGLVCLVGGLAGLGYSFYADLQPIFAMMSAFLIGLPMAVAPHQRVDEASTPAEITRTPYQRPKYLCFDELPHEDVPVKLEDGEVVNHLCGKCFEELEWLKVGWSVRPPNLQPWS